MYRRMKNLLIVLSMLLLTLAIIVCIYVLLPTHFKIDEKTITKIDIYGNLNKFKNITTDESPKILYEQVDINKFIDKCKKAPLKKTHIKTFGESPMATIVIHNEDNTEINIDFSWFDLNYTIARIMRVVRNENGIQILNKGKFYKISNNYLGDIFSFK